MGKRSARLAVAVVVPACLCLAACASSVDSSLAITNWLDGRGATCKSGGGYDATTVSAVPFTRVTCEGVQLEFFDSAAADRYDDFLTADCAAVPADQRSALADVEVVRGPTWVLRGTVDASGAWPETLVGAEGVTPDAAADALGGQRATVAQACEDLGAWPD